MKYNIGSHYIYIFILILVLTLAAHPKKILLTEQAASNFFSGNWG